MLKAEFSEKFKRRYKKLPQNIQKKVDKQLAFLQKDMFHPGLHTKKMEGINRWEARVDRQYRLTFEKNDDHILLRTLGPHYEGLGKK